MHYNFLTPVSTPTVSTPIPVITSVSTSIPAITPVYTHIPVINSVSTTIPVITPVTTPSPIITPAVMNESDYVRVLSVYNYTGVLYRALVDPGARTRFG